MVKQVHVRSTCIRKRDRTYLNIKRSKSQSNDLVKKLKTLKSEIQRETREAYWQYLDSDILANPPRMRKANKNKSTNMLKVTHMKAMV
jgi:hypothetical protein